MEYPLSLRFVHSNNSESKDHGYYLKQSSQLANNGGEGKEGKLLSQTERKGQQE